MFTFNHILCQVEQEEARNDNDDGHVGEKLYKEPEQKDAETNQLSLHQGKLH